MKQLNGFQNFDYEQTLKRYARKRQAKAIRCIPISETQEWFFTTDLDEEIDRLSARLEEVTCH